MNLTARITTFILMLGCLALLVVGGIMLMIEIGDTIPHIVRLIK